MGSETRLSMASVTPWRCKIPFTPGGKSALTFALGTPGAKARLRVRVSFVGPLWRSRVVYRGTTDPQGGSPDWQDVSVDLSSLPRRPGHLLLEVGGSDARETPFYLAEPVIFRPQAHPSRNLVLVLLDTLRADHVGFGGYRRPTTPRLDALASEGTVFTRAYAPSSWTRPSTATLLTGLAPSDHGVHTRRGRLPDSLSTLAGRLRAGGWATSALSSNPNVLPYWGFDRGFERFVDVNSEDWPRNDDVRRMVGLAMDELERIRNRPFFLYLHVNQIHAPYIPPEADRRAVAGEGSRPVDRYDGEIRFTDQEVGRFWDRLRSLGLADRTLLVVVGDHGEEFGEHGGVYHGTTLYEEVLKVPLFLRYPSVVPSGRRIDRRVRLVQLMPTILSLLNVQSPGLRPRSLLQPPDGKEADRPAIDYFTLDLDERLMQAVLDGRWKYIAALRPARKEELYDLGSDPGERRNLAAVEAAQRTRLAELLEQYLAKSRPGLRVRLSAGPGEKRDLGVLIETSGRIREVWKEGFHPNDRIEIERGEQSLRIRAGITGREERVEQLGRLVPMRYPDVGIVGLSIDPPDSTVNVRLISPDHGPGSENVRIGSREAATQDRFKANDPALSVSLASILAAPEGQPPVWIYRVPPPREARTIPRDIEERLRALGYVR